MSGESSDEDKVRMLASLRTIMHSDDPLRFAVAAEYRRLHQKYADVVNPPTDRDADDDIGG